MTFLDMPLIIPILAMAYVMTIYMLLSFAQKNSRLIPNANPKRSES